MSEIVNKIIELELELYDNHRNVEYLDYIYFKELFNHRNHNFFSYIEEYEEPDIADMIIKTFEQVKPRLVNRRFVVGHINSFLDTLHSNVKEQRENDNGEALFLVNKFYFYDEHNEDTSDNMDIKSQIRSLKKSLLV